MNSLLRTPDSQEIKVLLIDDSPVALNILGRILSSAPDIKVVGTANDGRKGLDLIPLIKPDVVSVDLHMPHMDGLEFVKECMARHPKPILVISVSVQEGSQNIFKLLEAGAIDVFAKPRSGIESEYDKRALELISKIRILSGVRPIRRTSSAKSGKPEMQGTSLHMPQSGFDIVAIGASTGGPQTLEEILTHLPANFPLPVVCVQHIGDEFLEGFIEWMASLCRVKVKIARSGESPEAGTVYFPDKGAHLKMGTDGRFSHSPEPPCDGHRPSVTVMMKSLAGYYGNRMIGILLTGMGRDGAEGMKEISKAGGMTIAQSEATSIVFGMPKAAIELKAAKYVLAPEEIVRVLNIIT